MKRLVLFRHGDSPFENNDFSRGLSELGVRQVKASAKEVLNKNIIPDLIIHSEAQRTTRTANIIGDELGLNSDKIIPYNELYNASINEIISIVREQDDSFNTILLVGHNPGLSELAGSLNGNIFINLGTSEFKITDLAISSWSKI